MNTNAKKNILIITILVFIFSIYNFFIYSSSKKEKFIFLSKKALKGEVLWQSNNCWSCHQIYGLGGYLGPDLTNIYSTESKGEKYIKAFLNSGIKSMPKFNFSEDEKNQIIAFLQQIDSTGYYPNKNAIIKNSGWVDIEYKNEK